MAESNQYRSDRIEDLEDDDPMLELARIMGSQPASAEPAQPTEDEFGIDLEKELLGDFGGPFGEEAEAAPGESEPAPSSFAVEEEAFGGQEEQSISPQPAEPAAYPGTDPSGVSFSDDMLRGTRADLVTEPAASPAPQESGDPLFDEMFRFDGSEAAPADEPPANVTAETPPDAAHDWQQAGAVEDDEDQLAADLAALDLAFSEEPADEAGRAEETADWQDHADTDAAASEPENEVPAGASFNELKAALADLGASPEPDADTEAEVSAYESADEPYGGDTPPPATEDRHWDGPESASDVDREMATAFDNAFGPVFDEAQPGPETETQAEPDSWSEFGDDLPDDSGDAYAGADESAAEPEAESVDIPEFDEDAFLDQSFIDDELMADLGIEDADGPEPAPSASDETSEFGADDGFDTAVDLEPVAEGFTATDGESGYSAADDLAQVAAIEDTFETADDSDKSPATDANFADEAPEIETTSLDDNFVPLADELDIPDFTPEEPVATAHPDEGFDTAYTAKAPEPEPEAAGDTGEEESFEAYFADEFAQMGFDLDDPARAEAAAAEEDAALAAVMRATREIGGAESDDQRDEDAVLPGIGHQDDESKRKRNRQGLLIAGAVAGIAILGGIGALTLTGGSDDNGGEPAIVRADTEPVKVKPADPGGKQVPNTERKVYEEVAGEKSNPAPEQKTLVTTSEEPMDIAARAPAADAAADTSMAMDSTAPKSEERIDPSAATDSPVQTDDEIIAVAPRKVKTYVVQPDGTLVEREAPKPAGETTAMAEPEPMKAAESAAADESAPLPQARPAEKSADTAGEKVAATEPAAETPEPAAETTEPAAEPMKKAAAEDTEPAIKAKPVRTTTIKAPAASKVPDKAPIIASRPANQPVNIVGRTGNAGRAAEAGGEDTQTASAASAAGTANTSPAWVQISSHTSRDLAQVSYRNDLRRYGNLISGRGVNIVAAEVRGRTWYRVNIPAQSWGDAAKLCQNIKAAGGDCLPKR